MKKNTIVFLLVLFCLVELSAQVYNSNEPLAHTFSIVARDAGNR